MWSLSFQSVPSLSHACSAASAQEKTCARLCLRICSAWFPTRVWRTVLCYKHCREIPISAQNERSQKYPIHPVPNTPYASSRAQYHILTLAEAMLFTSLWTLPTSTGGPVLPGIWQQLHSGTAESHGLSALSSRENTIKRYKKGGRPLQWCKSMAMQLCILRDQAYGVRRLGAIP